MIQNNYLSRIFTKTNTSFHLNIEIPMSIYTYK